MEDIKFILYVLAAVAYFVFMQWRKAFKSPRKEMEQEQPAPRPKPKSQQPQKPATSFEDILRELQPKLERTEQQEKKFEPHIPTVVKAGKPINAPKPAHAATSAEAYIPKALSLEIPAQARQAASLAAQRIPTATRFDSYERDIAPKNRYASQLRNPSNVRDAVVLSEIFKRKYE